jgi:hypothetical protein
VVSLDVAETDHVVLRQHTIYEIPVDIVHQVRFACFYLSIRYLSNPTSPPLATCDATHMDGQSRLFRRLGEFDRDVQAEGCACSYESHFAGDEDVPPFFCISSADLEVMLMLLFKNTYFKKFGVFSTTQVRFNADTTCSM